jgi:SAM-dependent methyltransferase
MDGYIKRVLRDLPHYPKTKLETYIYFNKVIPKVYVPVKSNKQISTIYKEYKKNPVICREWYYAILLLFASQYNLNDNQIIKVLENKDNEIYRYLRKNKVVRKNIPKARNNIDEEYIKYILAPYLKCIKNMLDVGCGLCYKTYYYGDYLGLKKEDIYGLNVEEDINYIDLYSVAGQNRKGINYNTYNKDEKFPYKRSKFSLLTFFLVLHHVEDLAHVLEESYRVLKKGGYLLIKDQDAFCGFDKMIFDIQHLFEYNRYDIKKTISTGNYMSWLKMNYIITSHGFKLINYYPDMVYYERRRNVLRMYYCLYQKI